MKKLGIVLAVIMLVLGLKLTVSANEAPAGGYCVPPNTTGTPGPAYSPIAQGQVVNAPPLVQALNHAELCSGNYGDVYTDGAFYSPSFTFSGSAFTFTIPANVFVSLGQRVFTVVSNETAPASQTTYYWLDCPQSCGQASNQGIWEQTTSASPPDSFASLVYIVVANGSGITGVTNPPMVTFLYSSPGNSGQVNCTLAATSSCNAAATVTSGAFCTASYDHAATTVTLTDLQPLQVVVSGTTLTVYMNTSASLTGTLAADVLCF